MENKTLEELYSDIYQRQASLSRCPNEHIRNPLDLECYHNDSEMGKFIRTMLYNLDKKKTQLEINKRKLEILGIGERIITTKISIRDFLNRYVLKFDDINVFLDSATCESPGIAYEFLWTICIYLGICDEIFPIKEYKPQLGNSNIPSSFKDLNISEWLSSAEINTGSSGGYSDITLKKTELILERDVCDPLYTYIQPGYILIQSKLINDELRSVSSDYDIEKLASLKAFDNKDLMSHYGGEEPPRIVLLVRDKQIVINKISNIKRSSRHLFVNFNKNTTDIYDIKDLERYYRRLKDFLRQFHEEDRLHITEYYDFNRLVNFYREDRTILKPRLHQLITLFKTVSRLESSSKESSNTFLYGAVARSGKTYMMGELVNYFNIMGRGEIGYRCYEPVGILPGYDIRKPFSFIIFSPVPNETIEEYKKLFKSYKEFIHYEVCVIQGRDNYQKFIAEYDPLKPYITIISKQTLDVDIKKLQPIAPEQEHEQEQEISDVELELEKQKEVDEMIHRLGQLLQLFKHKNGEITGIFFDEHHVSGCSEKSKKMLKEFKKPNMFPNLFYVFITATYNKSMFEYNIPSENIFTWNYEDIILSKELSLQDNYDRLLRIHGQSFVRALDCFKKMGYTIEDIEEEYKKFPEIHVLSHKWNKALIKRQIEKGGVEINFGELLRVNPDKNTEFLDGKGVDGLLRLIFGDMLEYTPFTDENRMCFFNRIKRISDRIGTRTLQDDSFTSQIWFLPIGTKGSGIESIANALEIKLNNNKMIKNNYAIFNMKDHTVVRGDQSYSYKKQIADKEKEAKDQGFKGLIILTGKQLSLGISLPCVDIVIMLNDIINLDLYYQMIFRSLTESSGKKAGFICDFNPDRTVSALYGQSMRLKGNDPKEDAKQKCIVENFIYLDNDLVEEHILSKNDMIDFFNHLKLTTLDGKILLSVKTMTEINNELKTLIDSLEIHEIQDALKRLEFDKVTVNEQKNETEKLEVKVNKDEKTLRQIQTEIDEFPEPTSREQVKELEKIKKKKESIEKKIKQNIEKMDELDSKIYIGHILIIIIKLGIYLTLSIDKTVIKSLKDIFTIIFDEDMQFKLDRSKKKSRLDFIKEYLQLLGIFRPENNEEKEIERINYVLELFNPVSKNNIINSIQTIDMANTNIENIQIDIKERISSEDTSLDKIEKVMTKRCVKNAEGKLTVNEDLHADIASLESCDEIPSILQKKRLLKYIEENLTPIEELKKKTGEVFTPWGLVDEMMQTIPADFWENPDHKILEPGSGFGPFAIWAYYRLMVGLKIAFPDEEERRKHIVENMLYMAELNGVNVDISRTIFSSNGLYRVNIYHGDFLELNPVEEWGVRQFDLICGNPPYNAPKDTQSNYTGSIYDSFTYKSIDLSIQFLLLVIPSRWFRKGARGLGDFREFMVQRRDLKLIKYFENSQDVFGTGVDIKGGICYFLIDKLYNGLTNFNGNMINLDKQEIITGNILYLSIIDKTKSFSKLNTLYLQPGYFEISTNFFNTYKIDQSLPNVECFVSQNKGFIQKINTKDIKKTFDFWKVITTEAAGKGNDGFGNIFIGNPSQIFSHTYIAFKVKTEIEAISLESYLNSNIANFLLSLKKNTQHITGEVLDLIPLPPLVKRWTNIDLYQYYKLTKEEINEIEKTISISTSSKLKEKLPKVVKDRQLSRGESAEQHEDEETADEEDDDVTEDEEDFTSTRGAVAAQHFPKEDDEQEALQVCLDSRPSVREYNAKLKYFTETLCDVVYLFNKEDDKMPFGYLNRGNPTKFQDDLIQQFERCVINQTSASCVGNCKWVRARSPNPGRCELKEYPVKAELTKYSNYFAKSRKQSAGKNNRKSKRPQKLKISKKQVVGGKNYRKSKRNQKY